MSKSFRLQSCVASTALALGLFAGLPLASGAVALETVSTGLSVPIFLTAPAGDNRLFVAERGGRVRLIENGVLSPTPVVNISTRVRTDGEHGLLGFAFSPNFATDRAFYLNYSVSTGANVVERFTLPVGSTTAASATGTVVFTGPNNGRTNHKGGWIGFRPGETGPGGTVPSNNLYISTGDSGGSDDPDNAAQNRNSELGKILRVNVSGVTAVPAPGNPFLGGATTDDNIWAEGLRNPYRNSFDRANGNFFIGDVGQNNREEVNFETPAQSGRNYGWRVREGSIQNPTYPGATAPAGAVGPVFDYQHNNSLFSPAASPANRGSITGGYVYRGSIASDLIGKYVFGDFVTGKLGAFDLAPGGTAAQNVVDLTPQLDPTGTRVGRGSLISFGEDSRGDLYVLTAGGTVYRVVPEPAALGLLAPLALTLVRRRA